MRRNLFYIFLGLLPLMFSLMFKPFLRIAPPSYIIISLGAFFNAILQLTSYHYNQYGSFLDNKKQRYVGLMIAVLLFAISVMLF